MIKRKFFSKILILALTLFIGCKDTKIKNTVAEKSNTPNVLFIAIDDLNDWVSCLQGHPQVQTPNIDRLASRGVLFTNAHTQSPICNPSRTSILTGYRPSSTGIYGLSPWIREVDELKDIVTLPQYFSANGYKTYSGGKIYHAGYGRRQTDKEFDSLGPAAGVKKQPPSKLAGVTPGGDNPWVDWGSFPLKENEIQDWEVATWASSLIKSEPEAPFFLSVGFFLPHVPLYAPESFFDQYPEETLQMPPMLKDDRADTPRASWFNHWDVPEPRWKWFQENQQDTLFVRSYLAAISFVDGQLGRVLDALDQSNQKDNTIIVLWSDHGFHLGEKEISGKNTLWERSTRVPLIFAGPGIEKNVKYDFPVELLDIYPTLNELCNFNEKEDLEGQSLSPQLSDVNITRSRPAITTNNYNNHAIRTKDWRYIQYANGEEELYDMVNDPNEWTNLIQESQHKFLVDSLKQWLPKQNKPPHVGDYQRILEYRDEKIIWQGKQILTDEAIPGF